MSTNIFQSRTLFKIAGSHGPEAQNQDRPVTPRMPPVKNWKELEDLSGICSSSGGLQSDGCEPFYKFLKEGAGFIWDEVYEFLK